MTCPYLTKDKKCGTTRKDLPGGQIACVNLDTNCPYILELEERSEMLCDIKEWKMIEEKLQNAVESCLKQNGYEWKPDEMASECVEVPDGETPYTHGQGLIDSLADLVQEKEKT